MTSLFKEPHIMPTQLVHLIVTDKRQAILRLHNNRVFPKVDHFGNDTSIVLDLEQNKLSKKSYL